MRLKQLLILTAALMTALSTHAELHNAPTIALIIDDIGHNYRNGADLAEMPYPLTLAFLPQRRHTKRLAELAHSYGKEIILHAPMENKLGIGLGIGGLTSTMSEDAFKRSLAYSIDSIPHLSGVNNHMGSLLTSQPKAMRWVMETLSNTPYFFVDSRTTASSVAALAAHRHGVPNMSRDVFLDNTQTASAVREQFRELIAIARRKGHAIGIGHPYPVTIDIMRNVLPKLDEMGIAIATAGALWQLKHPYSQMHSESTQNIARTNTIDNSTHSQKDQRLALHNKTKSEE